MHQQMTREDVLRTVADEKIKFVRFWFTDILGFLKSFAITDTQLESAFEEGRPRDHADHQPVGQLIQAAGSRL